MKTIRVYQSKTGYTKKYAQWLSESLACPVKSLKNLKEEDLQGYDLIIYGAGVYASKIAGLDKIKKMTASNNILAFGVGMTSTQTLDQKQFEELNRSGDKVKKIFYLRGGLDIKQLGFFLKFMMKMMKKGIDKKEEKSQDDREFISAFDQATDFTSKENLREIISYIKSI